MSQPASAAARVTDPQQRLRASSAPAVFKPRNSKKPVICRRESGGIPAVLQRQRATSGRRLKIQPNNGPMYRALQIILVIFCLAVSLQATGLRARKPIRPLSTRSRGQVFPRLKKQSPHLPATGDTEGDSSLESALQRRSLCPQVGQSVFIVKTIRSKSADDRSLDGEGCWRGAQKQF